MNKLIIALFSVLVSIAICFAAQQQETFQQYLSSKPTANRNALAGLHFTGLQNGSVVQYPYSSLKTTATVAAKGYGNYSSGFFNYSSNGVKAKSFVGNSLAIKYPWVDDSAFTSLTAARDYAIAKGLALHISQQYIIASNFDLSAVPEVVILKGANFAVSAGTLTFPTNTQIGIIKVFTVSGSGAVAGLKEDRPENFGTNATAFKQAVDSLSASGGVVKLQAATYQSPYTDDSSKLTKDNVSFEGSKMPSFASDNNSLINGTIIQGTFRLYANNISVKRFGVDCGLTVCNTLFAGVAQDCLIIANANAHTIGLTPFTGYYAEDIIALGKNATAPNHAFLVECTTGAFVKNIHTKYNQHGIVFKSIYATGTGLYASDHSSDGVIVKADNYAPCYHVNLSNVVIVNTTSGSGSGLQIYAATGVCNHINVTGISVDKANFGIYIKGDTSSTPVEDIHITNANVTNSSVTGVYIYGYVNYPTISNCTSNTNTGNGYFVDYMCNYVFLNGCSARRNGVGFDIRGTGTRLFNCIARESTSYGIYVEKGQWVDNCYFPVETTPYSGGIWLGGSGGLAGKITSANVSANVTTPTLLNSWVNYGGSNPTAAFWIDAGKVRLRGLVKSGTANPIFSTSPYVPAAPKRYLVTSYNGTAIVPCEISIGTTGSVIPNASCGNTYISLDNIEFSLAFD